MVRGTCVEVDAETFAAWQQTRAALDEEHGGRLTDSEVVQAMCRRTMEPAGEATPQPRQHAVTTCRFCKRGWVGGGEHENELTPSQIDCALCDEEYVGDLEDDRPTRPKAAISASTRRKVEIRDGNACKVPGCRSHRNLDVHHIVHRANGGGHEMANLVVLCAGHHQRHHDGRLSIRGRAPDALEFSWRHDDELGEDPLGPTGDQPTNATGNETRNETLDPS